MDDTSNKVIDENKVKQYVAKEYQIKPFESSFNEICISVSDVECFLENIAEVTQRVQKGKLFYFL